MRALFLALAAAAAIQAPSPAPERGPAARRRSSSTSSRRTHAARPSTTLKASDFVLREDGEVQAIQDVRFVKPDGNAAPLRHLPGRLLRQRRQHRRRARRPAPLRRPGSASGRSRHDSPPARFAVDDSPDARPRRRSTVPSTRSKDAAATTRRGPLSNATTWSTTRRAPTSSARSRRGRRSTRSRCIWPTSDAGARRCCSSASRRIRCCAGAASRRCRRRRPSCGRRIARTSRSTSSIRSTRPPGRRSR